VAINIQFQNNASESGFYENQPTHPVTLQWFLLGTHQHRGGKNCFIAPINDLIAALALIVYYYKRTHYGSKLHAMRWFPLAKAKFSLQRHLDE